MKLADFDAAQRLVRRRTEVRQEHQDTLRKLRNLVSEPSGNTEFRGDHHSASVSAGVRIKSGLERPLAAVTEAADEFYATVLTDIDAQLLRYGIETEPE